MKSASKGPKASMVLSAFAVLVAAVVAVIDPVRASGTDGEPYESFHLSGIATGALVRAAEHLLEGSPAPAEAARALGAYAVLIRDKRDETVFAFYPNVGDKQQLVAHFRTSGFVSYDDVRPIFDVSPIVVPGVTAGEIVAAYSVATRENDTVLKNGPTTFRTDVSVLGGKASIAFIPLNYPTQGPTCMGNCNGRSVYWVSLAENGELTVVRRSIY